LQTVPNCQVCNSSLIGREGCHLQWPRHSFFFFNQRIDKIFLLASPIVTGFLSFVNVIIFLSNISNINCIDCITSIKLISRIYLRNIHFRYTLSLIINHSRLRNLFSVLPRTVKLLHWKFTFQNYGITNIKEKLILKLRLKLFNLAVHKSLFQ
jgi:hypothetical protein